MQEPIRNPVVLRPGKGRDYHMGGLFASFKADGPQTAGRYSISEWWIDAHTTGPGPHSHPEDDVFYVLAGTISFLVGERWQDCPAGSFILVPGDTVHDFQNRGPERAGMLNFSAPGNFEEHMPGIVDWFAAQPPGRTA
jgi:quercetin dioxygenase-like cupin family protein